MSFDSAAVRSYVALQTEFIQDWLLTFDYSHIRLYNTSRNRLVRPPDLFRRGNDWMAAAYLHSVALHQNSGDDCVDAWGNRYELKLGFINSKDIHFGPSGTALLHGAGGTSFNQAFNAKYRVHQGTQLNHHNQETGYVFMSHDHNCYITGFMMTGNAVQKVLMEGGQTTTDRNVSLGQFIRDGHEFKSSVPHIGWERYYKALFNFVAAREGRIIGDEAKLAIDQWVNLADPRNLQKL